MDQPSPEPTLSREATEIVDQLVDIAHDEGDPMAAGIEWYLDDEEPPLAALEELERAGICEVERDDDSVVVEFTAAGAQRYA